MNKEELFAAAKDEIFGVSPACPMARVGRNMAISYFNPIIEDAEAVLLDLRVPHSGFATTLLNACKFYDAMTETPFPPETIQAVKRCQDNFCARYDTLLKELSLKAA